MQACGGLCGVISSCRTSTDSDVLLPYAHGHGPSHSHRHVRDCQSVAHGSITYETWPSRSYSSLPVAESTVFISDMPGRSGSSRWVYGHMTVVQDPLRTLSVLEPGGSGGCEKSHRVSVVETAETASCLYAQNAGYFNTTTDGCLGNMVSDGRMVRDGGGVQNAQFGIRKDGSLVFGYLSQEDVLDQSNPFVQLVSGVVWLLRNGEVYINQSLEAECDELVDQEMFRNFVDVLSARTAVGHDANGNVVLFHVDGQTNERGMNLWEVADFLKKNGVINAVNLDGGGSSSFVVNGTLASYPPDQCEPDSRWRCARRVSTILCVHRRRCQPENCSGNGDCVDGRCRCQEGWQGAACDSLVCQPPACGPHGVCTANGCVCAAGWRGKNCSQGSLITCDQPLHHFPPFSSAGCFPGYYGDGCRHTCVCFNGASCNRVDGRCVCPPGFYGNLCEKACPPGFYGVSCAERCQCDDQCPCDPHTGSCVSNFDSRLNRAGQCLAKQMFTVWRQQEEAYRDKPYLTEQTWLIITVVLASLLLVPLVFHFMRASRRWLLFGYSYTHVPLSNANGDKLSLRLLQLH
ncbi:N-acetylglucosamine-1-phosphodiester alpha-N-acetylglucosaminidase-like isoform X4 [Thunnus maccoyii]|uniref:N-acetylglucosamine-1-phosphodiester alpha-N-acetylglucosaminidase-like isoform X4 n=1 Tax=Thunnus maccoyii TaxID=8240 RepID=UPI001C4D0F78|nr:N-acetylglucosamine-1-phosphodiester alpha-N-acetylglucosaminidase-like isoform X4 [Thunnus maccoyii]